MYLNIPNKPIHKTTNYYFNIKLFFYQLTNEIFIKSFRDSIKINRSKLSLMMRLIISTKQLMSRKRLDR